MRIMPILLAAMIGCSAANAQTPQPAPAPTPALKFAYGQWWNGCGPVDEPTYGITLTPVHLRCNFKKLPVPRINVQFAYLGSKSAPIAIEDADHRAGRQAQAWRCLSENGQCEEVTNGTIRLAGPKGTYELKFADGSVEKGSFYSQAVF